MNSNNFSIIFIFVGLVTYILVDQGVFQFDSTNSIFGTDKENKNLENSNKFEVLSNKTQADLDRISEDLKAGKGRLRVIQVAADQFEKELIDKRKQLKELDQQIAQLKTISKTKPKRDIANEKKSESQLISTILDSMTPLEPGIEVEKSKLGNYSAVRIKTKMTYQSEDSVYLTPNGIKKVKALIKSVADNGYKKIYLAYKSDSSLTKDKIRSVSKLVMDVSMDRVGVKSIRINDPEIVLVDDFEVWIPLEDLG